MRIFLRFFDFVCAVVLAVNLFKFFYSRCLYNFAVLSVLIILLAFIVRRFFLILKGIVKFIINACKKAAEHGKTGRM